jgi:hypothetical protein
MPSSSPTGASTVAPAPRVSWPRSWRRRSACRCGRRRWAASTV